MEYPDGKKLEANNKTQVSLDYAMEKNQNYTFKVKTNLEENIQEKTICMNDEFISNNGLSLTKVKDEEGYKTIEIKNKIRLNNFKTYYKIGENGEWKEGGGKISILDYDVTTSNLINEDKTVTIEAKIENERTKSN